MASLRDTVDAARLLVAQEVARKHALRGVPPTGPGTFYDPVCATCGSTWYSAVHHGMLARVVVPSPLAGALSRMMAAHTDFQCSRFVFSWAAQLGLKLTRGRTPST